MNDTRFFHHIYGCKPFLMCVPFINVFLHKVSYVVTESAYLVNSVGPSDAYMRQ